MTKLISVLSVAFILICSFALTAFAENIGDNEIEYYEGLDDYEEFEQDYYQTFEPKKKEPRAWYKDLSPIPPVIGILAGAGTVFILYRKQATARRQSVDRTPPHTADIKHEHRSER